MSFLPINEQNQMAPQGQTTNAPTSQGNVPAQTGGSAGAGAGGGAAKGSMTGTPTQFGSSASKLGDYLSANAPQIQNTASNIAGGLNTQYGQVGTDINNATSQFGNQVNAGYNAANPDLTSQALANPTQFAATPNNVSAFQGQLNDTYTGPQNFESTTPYSNIQNEVNTAVQNGGLLGTQAGLQNYFQQQYNANGGGNNNTQASSTLDALLLGNNPTLQRAVGQFQQLPGQFNQNVATADALVPQAQQNAANIAAQTQGQFNTGVQNFGNQLTQNAAQAEAQRTAYNNELNNYYNNITPVEQQVEGWLGQLPGNVGANVPNVFGQAISQNPLITNAITAQNYATPQQYAEAAALQQLAGTNNPITLPINASTANLAGTAPSVPQNPQLSSISTLLGSTPQGYYAQLGNAFQNSMNWLNNGFNSTPSNTEAQAPVQQAAWNNLAQYLVNLENQQGNNTQYFQ